MPRPAAPPRWRKPRSPRYSWSVPPKIWGSPPAAASGSTSTLSPGAASRPAEKWSTMSGRSIRGTFSVVRKRTGAGGCAPRVGRFALHRSVTSSTSVARPAGWVMWALLWLHAASRALAFGVIARAAGSGEGRRAARTRRDHHRRVVRGHAEVRALAGLHPPRQRDRVSRPAG